MAAQTTIGRAISADIEAVYNAANDLKSVSADWAALSEVERVTGSLDWDQAMASYLPLLDRAYRAGQMTEDEQAQYRLLLGKLKELLPTVTRLNLYRPPVILDLT